MHTATVAGAACSTRGVFILVPSERCIVAETCPRLDPKKPLVPGQAPVAQWAPWDRVEMVMPVRRDKVMGPHFVGGQDVFTLSYDIPGGSVKRWGGGRVVPSLAY